MRHGQPRPADTDDLAAGLSMTIEEFLAIEEALCNCEALCECDEKDEWRMLKERRQAE